MSSDHFKWACMTESQNGSKWTLMSSKDPKYIQNDPIWAQNRPKWAQMSKPKKAEKSLNDLKWGLMRSNFNKIFTSDAYPV